MRLNLHSVIHGKRKTATYNTWANMIQRCTNRKRPDYAVYGGRGIKVCERWLIFANFLADMGDRPPGKTLDRFPNRKGNYEPGNCRWATRKEQSENSATPILVTRGDVTLNIKEWAQVFNVRPDMLYTRRYRHQDIFKGLS